MAEERESNRKIGRYEIREEIGRGGMAVVYRALDTVLRREVALKLLHPHLASHFESRERFEREARAVALLHHPAILEIYDYSGESGDEVFLVMELVRGTTLRRFLETRPPADLAAEWAALVVGRVAGALAHAHANGVIHRDVKPENILIGPGGDVKLSDFGIAQLAGLTQMTATGQILGSPAYMSPEHVERADLDARADIFSLGTILYEIAVGRPPFQGKNPHAVIKRIIECDYDDPLRAQPAVGHKIAAIIRRCLRADPQERYACAADIASEIDGYLTAMGLGPAEEEIVAFFADPAAWSASRRSVVLARTLDMGLAARRRRRLPEAMDHFNRVLAMEPGQEKALAAVAGLSRRRRMRRLAERLSVAAAVVVLAGAVVWTATERGDAKGGRPGAQAARKGRADSRKTDRAASSTSTAPASDPGGAAARPAPGRLVVSAVSFRKREVIFTPVPGAVSINIDGKERFVYGPTNQSRRLVPGSHRISFLPVDVKHFFESSQVVDIPAGDEPFRLRERLRWRPASLTVKSNVDTVVTLTGRGTGHTNRPFDVEVRQGPVEQLQLLVSSEGYSPATRQVTIEAGEAAEITVNLTPSRQETAAP
ncbi:MAG: serine/threonine protein kinase [Deltaproteobacteria bacterium]|nr:serine/threonine protein kinase [Deltaproteobacteria bacterium]